MTTFAKFIKYLLATNSGEIWDPAARYAVGVASATDPLDQFGHRRTSGTRPQHGAAGTRHHATPSAST